MKKYIVYIWICLFASFLPAQECYNTAEAIHHLTYELRLWEVNQQQKYYREGESPFNTLRTVLEHIEWLGLKIKSGEVTFTPGLRSSAQLTLELVKD